MIDINLNIKLFNVGFNQKSKLETINLRKQFHNDYVLIFLENSEGFWKIPDEVDLTSSMVVYTDISEFGGLTSSGPNTRIVCSIVGSKIKPYYISYFRKPLGVHARFAVNFPIIGIESNDYNEIEIMEYRSFIDKNERSCYLTEQVIFHGDPRNLPEELHYYFSSPINHLLVKASCYKCTHVHYSLRD